ncbi:MAG TPA: nitroreductase family protein [Methylophilaceae bacterium]|jgi:nitroreductase
MKKPAITQVDIHPLIAERWSSRAYDGSKSVTQEQIIALLEAARWAPSCYGDQPWRFVLWNKATDPAGWQQALECLVPGNQSWVKDAPLLILVAADSLFNHNGQANRWAQYDTGAAAENLCLQAEALGLKAHQMGGFDVDKARAVAAVPPQYHLMAMLSVGYAAALEDISDDLKGREIAPRVRRELHELFFAGSWGKHLL